VRHVRFRDPTGATRRGAWHDDGTVSFAGEYFDRDEVTVLPPCEPSKVVCVGRNYAAHADERDEDLPDRPLLFLKPPNAVAAHGDVVRLPAGKERVEHECELAVVVGEQCRHVDAADAESVVAGYTCLLDVSNRDDQDRETNWVRGKAFDGAAPVGPVLADPAHLPDDAAVETYVNGERRQHGTLDQLIFSVPDLIEEVTRYMTLEPGDVLSTGTPAGVAPLAAGDEVRVRVEGVGSLVNPVERESRS
jgi:2-keto-4-pentenoate hydratase/2-oxohepta-3-ene-1,7-dioic acid hydratase in catechol pathway